MTITKRKKLIIEKIDALKAYELIEALELYEKSSKGKV